MLLAGITSLTHAQTLTPNLHIEYKNNLLTVTAQKADLKDVLLKLSDKTGIYVRYPSSLKKQITTELIRVPLSKALLKILEGTNHVIIYSGSGKNRAVVSKVFVYRKSKRSYRKSKRSRISGQSISQEELIASRIKSYEKRLELMNKKLSGLDKNSRLGKRYSRQIRSYENVIKNLKRKIQ